MTGTPYKAKHVVFDVFSLLLICRLRWSRRRVMQIESRSHQPSATLIVRASERLSWPHVIDIRLLWQWCIQEFPQGATSLFSSNSLFLFPYPLFPFSTLAPKNPPVVVPIPFQLPLLVLLHFILLLSLRIGGGHFYPLIAGAHHVEISRICGT